MKMSSGAGQTTPKERVRDTLTCMMKGMFATTAFGQRRIPRTVSGELTFGVHVQRLVKIDAHAGHEH